MIVAEEQRLDVSALPLREWRCSRCNRILAKLRLGPGSEIEVKCHSCNAFSYRSVEFQSQI